MIVPFIDLEKAGRTGMGMQVNQEFCLGHVKSEMSIRHAM